MVNTFLVHNDGFTVWNLSPFGNGILKFKYCVMCFEMFNIFWRRLICFMMQVNRWTTFTLRTTASTFVPRTTPWRRRSATECVVLWTSVSGKSPARGGGGEEENAAETVQLTPQVRFQHRWHIYVATNYFQRLRQQRFFSAFPLPSEDDRLGWWLQGKDGNVLKIKEYFLLDNEHGFQRVRLCLWWGLWWPGVPQPYIPGIARIVRCRNTHQRQTAGERK